MIVVVLLGVVLVGVPLYLWRRPRSVVDPVAGDAGTLDGALADSPFAMPVEVDASSAAGLRLGDARVLECRDSGSKRVPSEQCDALPAFAKNLAEAILTAKNCLPKGAGPGTITYVANVGFSRRRAPVTLILPKDGRSFRGSKVVAGCAAAVRAGMTGAAIDDIPHNHSRYKIAIVATYPALDAGVPGGTLAN